MTSPLATLRRMSSLERTKAGILFGWFFLVITTLWLLKPIRNASLLAHLGSEEIPYVRIGSVVVVGLVVAAYSRIVRSAENFPLRAVFRIDMRAHSSRRVHVSAARCCVARYDAKSAQWK